MVKAVDCGVVYASSNFSHAIMLTSDKYSWERYEPPYPSSYGLNSTTSK